MLPCKEFLIRTAHFSANCIRFGKGPKTLILIPGLNVRDARGKMAALGVAYAYRCFAKDYTVYVFDRRVTLPEHFSVEEIAEDIADCMAELSLIRADVFGVSQGGMIAQYLALNHPELVDRLVLGVTASRPNETLKAAIGRWCTMAIAGDIRGMMKDYFYNTYSDAYLKKYAFMIPLLLMSVRPMPTARFLTLAEACLTCNTFDRLSEIRCPVLVLGGSKDKIVSPQSSLEIAEKLGCEPVMYAEHGHSAYEEAPDFNRRVLAFLQNDSTLPCHGLARRDSCE